MTCICGRIKVGLKTTDARDWNPDCGEHGLGSDWYDSPEQTAKREARRTRTRDLQMQARAARRAAASGPIKETNDG